MENANALVLRTVDFSESSLIVTLFTREFGKIEALAKGGRRLKGPFESALDILAQNRVTLIQKRGDVLDLLTETKLVKRFSVTASNLAGLYGAYYVVELIHLMTDRNDAAPNLYDLAVDTLAQLETGTFVMRSLIRFESGLLRLIGQQPSIDRCAECGVVAEFEKIGRHGIAFGCQEGGILCKKCVTELRAIGPLSTISISAEALQRWGQITDIRDKTEQWKLIPLSKNVSGEIRGLLNRYIVYQIGRKPRLYDWFIFISRNDREPETDSA